MTDRFAADAPTQAGPPTKDYTASRLILIVAFLGLIGLIIGSISTQANAPASGTVKSLTASTPAPEPLADDPGEPRAPARAPVASRRADRTVHRRMAFNDCINEAADMADAIGIAPAVSQSSSGNTVSARFEFRDGAVVITCHRAEGVMTVERR